MLVENNVALQPLNSFGIAARAQRLVRLRSEDDLRALMASPDWAPPSASSPVFVLGGGSNLVLTGDLRALVLKVEIGGRRLVQESDKGWLIEAGAGENWHGLVSWTLDQGWPGLENMALIPGSVGASPVQNIGAYGVELQDRFHSLDAVDLHTGQAFTLNAAQCGFGYRDSVFKHAPGQQGTLGLAGRALITHVRFALPKRWVPEVGYLELARRVEELASSNFATAADTAATATGTVLAGAVGGCAVGAGAECGEPAPRVTPQQVFDWVCDIRRAKLPDPAVVGNAGSFFKNPTVTPEQCADIIGRDPKVVHYPLADGRTKLAAGWLIDACGWRGKSIGQAGVYSKQALVLVNLGTPQDPCTGGQVMTLAKAIQTSVYERFGLMLEIEPVVV